MGLTTRIVLRTNEDVLNTYETLNAFKEFNKQEGNFNSVSIKGTPIWDTTCNRVSFYQDSLSFFINVGSTKFDNEYQFKTTLNTGEKYGIRQVFYYQSNKIVDYSCYENSDSKGCEISFSLGANEEAVDYLRKFGLFVMNHKQELFNDKSITLYLQPYDHNDEIELFLKEKDDLKFKEEYEIIKDHRKEDLKTEVEIPKRRSFKP